MKYEVIPMSDKYDNVTLTTYVNDDSTDMTHVPRRAVIVCPGGGYHFLSDREAEPIVAKFFGEGFNVFLLRYSVEPDTCTYEPLKQVAHSVAHVRMNAEKYNVDPDKIAVIGFSAGGHLAASCGIYWNHPVLREEFKGLPEGINRPNGMMLSYPVITAGDYAHKKSFRCLTGSDTVTDEIIEEWSLERHVDGTTPPAFIWHTLTDKTVPIQNSLMLADALTKAGVAYELHIYPEGPHGLSLANEETWNGMPGRLVPHVQSWIKLAIDWAKTY